MKTAIQRRFAPFKKILPHSVWTRVRAVTTALITPIAFTLWSGHLRSSLKEKSVSRQGEPRPWYTYPCIHFLMFRDFSGRRVLEFGGGQSTLWWASRSDRVVTIEEDEEWHAKILEILPKNVQLYHVASRQKDRFLKEAFLAKVREIVQADAAQRFDVIVIDGNHFRAELVDITLPLLAEGGALICDDSEGYGIYEATRDLDVGRVDFFGHQPGVVLPHCTSVVFRKTCFLFDPKYRIPDVATEPY